MSWGIKLTFRQLLYAQAPHASLIPKNCTIKYWNFFDGVTEEMTGRYDLVHIRLLVLVIEQSQTFVNTSECIKDAQTRWLSSVG
jgi:hypothetical protein